MAAWIGLFVAAIGVLIVTLSKTPGNADNNSIAGNLLVSAAAFSWAAASVWSMPMMRSISPVALTFFSIAAALPMHFAVAGRSLDFAAFFNDRWLLLAILYSGIFSTGFASAFWNFGLKCVGPSHASVFQYLVPVITLTASWFLLAEVPYRLQIGGGVLIIVGLMVMRMWKQSASPRQKEPAAKPRGPSSTSVDPRGSSLPKGG